MGSSATLTVLGFFPSVGLKYEDPNLGAESLACLPQNLTPV